MNDYGFRHRALTDEPDEIDQEHVAELQEQIATAHEALQTFHSNGWPHIAATLTLDMKAAELTILSGRFEDDPKKSSYVRGQIAAYRTLLELPARVQQDVSVLEQKLHELTERPE